MPPAERITRSYKPWTPTIDAALIVMLREGVPNVEIARLLERTPGTLNAHKRLLGLIDRSPECVQCHAPLVQAGIGRPRRYCSPECMKAAQEERQRPAKEAALAARQLRTCAGPGCDNPLPTTNTQRRYCSRLCRGRGHESTYQRKGKGT